MVTITPLEWFFHYAISDLAAVASTGAVIYGYFIHRKVSKVKNDTEAIKNGNGGAKPPSEQPLRSSAAVFASG